MMMPRKPTQSRKGMKAYIGAMLANRDRLIRRQKPYCRSIVRGVSCMRLKL